MKVPLGDMLTSCRQACRERRRQPEGAETLIGYKPGSLSCSPISILLSKVESRAII
jgi:hypothetical protein